MKRILLICLAVMLCLPFSAEAERRSRKKIYPMMAGPKVSLGVFEGDESIYPVTVSGDMLINLYKNYFWLRMDPLALRILDGGNTLSINMGSPMDFVLMWHINQWRPYGFGGFGIQVQSFEGVDPVTWAGFDLGGGVSYEAARGLHLFGEAGMDLGYTNPSVGDAVDFRLFAGIGARFAFLW